MATIEKHSPGSFCWLELSTTDSSAAKAFYTGLFGWEANDLPMGPDSFYTMLRIDGKDVGALYEMDANERKSAPPHWSQYVAVESADRAVARAAELGGNVLAGPFDVFDAGRMAVIQDPWKAILAVWEPRKHIGLRLYQEPNALCWSELLTRDPGNAIGFYTRLFGWKTRQSATGENYTEILNQGQAIGGVMEIQPEWGAVPPHWMPYIMVTGCDDAAGKAMELGGTLKLPPTDIPTVGRFAVISDPQGAVFSIIQLAA